MTEYFNKKLGEIQKDPEQLKAYDTLVNTVVIAGPGSGKTTVLTLKVMRLLDETISQPRGLACLTYSTEAAREFKDRLYKLGLKKQGNVFLGTVHSFCLAEILTPFAHLYPQYRIPNPIKIISDKDKKKLFDSIPNEGRCDMTEMDKERTRDIQGISRVAIESYDVALKVAVEFEDALLNGGWIDFISMVKLAVKLIQNEPYVRKSLEARFPWVIVDEYQDLGRPLHEIILALLNLTNINEQIKRFYDRGIPYHEIAVLVGYNNQVKALCSECDAQDIPTYVARQEFRNTDAIYWLQNCTRWVENKTSVSFDEICSSWRGFLTLKNSNAVDGNEYLSIKKAILRILTESKGFENNLSEWLAYIFTELNFTQVFSHSDRYPDEIENLSKLFQIVKESQPTLTIGFISRLGVPENQVMLSTRHSAKGLEFDAVIMLGMEKDSFPSYYDNTQRKLEEARRLCFVAVSRARKACLLVRSKQLQNKYGRWFPKEPSPFWTTLYEYANS